MELVLLGLAGLGGLAYLVQAKALPSEADLAKAKAKLEASPLDPDANLTVGKYMAFVAGDYPGAMPYLVNSSDKTLKSLAEHELDASYSDTAPKKIGMGDEWVAAAKNYKPLYRSFYARASQYYAAAFPDLEGVWKDKTRERLKKMMLIMPPGTTRPGLPTGWSSNLATAKVAIDASVAHSGGKSLRIDAARAKPSEYFFVQSQLMVAPKGTLTYTVWIATDGTENPKDEVLINWYSASKALIGKSGAFVPLDSPFWQKIEVKAEVPKDAVRFLVEVGVYSANGTIWADDFSLKDAAGKEYVDNGSFEK